MANIVISNTGGFFSATTTWVGGVVPVAADSISASTTSGSLTISDERTCAGMDLQLYTSTLVMRAGITINGTILRLGSGMTITAPLGSVGVLRCRAATTLTSNGCVVPFFAFNFNTNALTRTLTDNWTITNYLAFMGNGNAITNGFAFNITNMILTIIEGGNMGRMNGTTQYRFNGANCSYDASATNAQTNFHWLGNPVYIDTPGTFTITNYMMLNPYSNTSGLYYIQGSVVGDKKIIMGIPSQSFGGNTTYNFDVNGIGTWDEIQIANNNPSFTSTFNLISNLNFNNLYFSFNFGNPQILSIGAVQTRQPIIFSGSGALKGGSIYTQSMLISQTPSPTYLKSTQTEIRLNSGVIHTASYLSLMGGGGDTSLFNRVLIRSVSGGTQATLTFTGNTQGVFYTNFTDINASGGNTIYTFSGTTSNTQNILPISSYVPTSSNTFLNG